VMRRTVPPVDARRSLDPEPESGCSGRRVLPPPAIIRSRTISVLLVGLALTSLVSACAGASPETRARQTQTTLHSTSTPTPLRATRTAIVQGAFTRIDQESAVIRTAEASLPVTSGTFRGIRTPVPRNIATHLAENQTD
jgi:hypothetical protein